MSWISSVSFIIMHLPLCPPEVFKLFFLSVEDRPYLLDPLTEKYILDFIS